MVIIKSHPLLLTATAEEMDKHDDGLRETIRKLWPIQGKKLFSIMVPPNDGIK